MLFQAPQSEWLCTLQHRQYSHAGFSLGLPSCWSRWYLYSVDRVSVYNYAVFGIHTPLTPSSASDMGHVPRSFDARCVVHPPHFLIRTSDHFVVSRVCSLGRPAFVSVHQSVLHGKTFTVDFKRKFLKLFFFSFEYDPCLLAPLTSTILCNF